MKRNEVPIEQTWDLGLIYNSPDEAWQDAEELQRLTDKVEAEYKGNLKDAQSIVDCLHLYERMHELAVRFSDYFGLAMETDFTNGEAVSNANKAERLVTNFQAKTSFIESEILEADESVLKEAIEKAAPSPGIFRKCCGENRTPWIRRRRRPSPHWASSCPRRTRSTIRRSFPICGLMLLQRAAKTIR